MSAMPNFKGRSLQYVSKADPSSQNPLDADPDDWTPEDPPEQRPNLTPKIQTSKYCKVLSPVYPLGIPKPMLTSPCPSCGGLLVQRGHG